jgi:Ca-activated chloride channel family protein
LFVADSGHDRIVVAQVTVADGQATATLEHTIGTGSTGAQDGSFATASFNQPQGMALGGDGQTLWIADTDNHLLRRTRLDAKTVETVAGTGRQGRGPVVGMQPPRTTPLNSPWDLCLHGSQLYIAMAGPQNDVRTPRNRAVVMLVIDVSQSMRATDVEPSRLAAAQAAAKQFADQLTAGINLGLIAYAGTATVLVSPTANREPTKIAIDKLQLADRTATGEAIFTSLQAIATVGAVIGGGDGPPPGRIVLMSDGKETVPSNPDNPKGAYTAARTAKDQGVPISTVSFGTPYGYVEINDQRQPVPVDEAMLKKIAELSDGTHYSASTLEQLKEVFTSLQDQIGYETVKGDASVGWLRLGTLLLALSALAAVLLNRRLPG